MPLHKRGRRPTPVARYVSHMLRLCGLALLAAGRSASPLAFAVSVVGRAREPRGGGVAEGTREQVTSRFRRLAMTHHQISGRRRWRVVASSWSSLLREFGFLSRRFAGSEALSADGDTPQITAAISHPAPDWRRSEKPDGSRPTECDHPTSLSGDRGSRAPQTQIRRKRQSWMVQLTIRLLTGRFQVRILVAEPFELEIGPL